MLFDELHVQRTRALWDALKRDRARLRMLKMSPFCIVEMTRQRQRQSLRQSPYVECPGCRGSGHVKRNETLALQILREIKAGADADGLDRAEVRVSPQVADYLNNEMRARLGEIEEAYGKHVQVLVDTSALPGQYMLKFLTAQGREVKPQKG